MESLSMMERDTSAIGNLFQLLVSDMKGSGSAWDDLAIKATKLHSQLKATIAASTAFLDSFQKIADIATSTRGGTKDIGSALTRLCLRQRSVEARLKTFTSSLMDCLVLPLQDRLEEWKRTTVQLDKERSKEIKRIRQELKKRNAHNYDSATLKLQKKLRASTGASGHLMSKSVQSLDGSEKVYLLEEMEKRSLRRALIEERSRFCLFVNFLRPVLDEEIAMLGEVNHLSEIMDHLSKLTCDPYILPPSSESVITDLKLGSSSSSVAINSAPFKSMSQLNLCTGETGHSPPSSPSSFGSRKSSMCSISSYNSNNSGREESHSPCNPGHHRHRSQQPHRSARYRSLSQVSSYSEHSSSLGSVPAATPTVPTSANLDGGIYSRPRFINGSTTSSHYHLPSSSSIYKGSSIGTEYDVHQTPTAHITQQQLNDSSAYSEGSITPTNNDIRSVSPTTSHSTYYYGSTATLIGTSFDTYSSNSNSNKINNINNNSVRRDSCYSTVSSGQPPALPARNSSVSYSPATTPLSRNGDSDIYASCGTLSRSSSKRPAPPPLPARRSSTLTDPNAITLATLASTGCSTYEQVQSLRKFSVSDASIYQSLACDQSIYSNLSYTPSNNLNDSLGGSRTVPPSQVASPIKQQATSTVNLNSSFSSNSLPYSQSYLVNLTQSQQQQQQHEQTTDGDCIVNKQDKHSSSPPLHDKQTLQDLCTIESASSVLFGNISALLASSNATDDSSGKKSDSSLDTTFPLPPPPLLDALDHPAAAAPAATACTTDSTAASHRKADSYNRLSNVSDQFLQTLNTKLAVSQQQRMSPRLIKRRSMSVGEHEFTGGSDSDSGIYLPGALTSTSGSPGSTSATSSINSTGSSLQQSFMRLMGAASSALTTSTATQPSFASSLSARLSHRFNSPDVSRRMSFGKTSSDLASEVAKAAASMAASKARKFECQDDQLPSTASSASSSMLTGIVNHDSMALQSSHCTSVYSALPAKVAYSPLQSPVKESSACSVFTAAASSPVTNFTHSTGSPVAAMTVNATSSPSSSLLSPTTIINTCNAVNNGKRGSLPVDSNTRRQLYQSQPRHNSTGSVLSNVTGALGSFENAITSKVTTWFTGHETLMEQIRNGNHQLKKVPDPSDRSQPKLAL